MKIRLIKSIVIALIMLAISLSATSCFDPTNDVIIIGTVKGSEINTQSVSTAITSALPTTQQSQAVVTTDTVVVTPTGTVIVANKSTKKIHIDPECTHAKKIKEENKVLYDSSQLDSLIDQGYSLCSYCGK